MKNKKISIKRQPGRQIAKPRGRYKEMATFIKNSRLNKTLSQAQLASFFGCHSQYVANWEAGVSLPPVALLTKLAKKLEIPIANLIDLRADELKKKWRTQLKIKLRKSATFRNSAD